MKSSVYARNMKILRKRMSVLARAMELSSGSDCEYLVERAKNSSNTLAIKKDDKIHQIHSKYNPQREASQQVAGMGFKNPKLLVVLGLGLGYHIRACLEELKDSNLFMVVVEKDVEALRVAIENVDISDLLASERIRWVIGVPENEGYAVLNDMVKQAGIGFQLFLKTLQIFDHPAINKVHGDYHKHMIKCFREAAHAVIFNYGNCPEDSMIGVENIMKNLSTIMRNPGIKDMYGAFKGVPGVIVSTGPSLDKNVEQLKNAVGKCVMISADSALKVLLKHDITPHAAVSLERILNVARMFWELPDDYKKKIWLAATPVIRKEAYDAWPGPTFMVYRAFAHFEWIQMPKGTLNIGPSCSNMAFKILEALGCDPIILVGQDCAFQSAEKTHADSAPSVTNLNLKERDLIKVKGNVEEWVYTNNIYDMFRKAFVTDIAQYRGTCVNSTEGGAWIEGSVQMPLRESIAKYCNRPVETLDIFQQKLHYPTENEIMAEYTRFRQTMIDTRKEVEGVIEYCDRGEKMIADFEDRLEKEGFAKIEDFLERFPDEELDAIHAEMTRARSKIITFGKYFNLYLMHIVQMIIVKFEMDFNELPSLCEDKKRCKLQGIKLMKRWFPTIGDVCRLSLKLLVDAYNDLEKEFGKAA
ncbi:MAG: 6-hydroxymethylpterin diphosphokinase MptE-like protein [Candidatus Riflebacteria bacterium]